MFGLLFLLACADPKPTLAAPVVPSSHAVESRAVIGDVDSILDCWARASKHRTPSKSDVDNLRLWVSQSVNGHAAISAKELLGVVDAAKLKEQFTWSFVEHVDDTECLEAIPNDLTDKLFFGSIRVWLTTGQWRIEKVQVADRHGRPAVTWRTTPRHEGVVLASLAEVPVDRIPPSPNGTVDTRHRSASTAVNPISLVNLHAILCLAPTIPAETKAELVEPTTLSPVSPELAVILAKWEQSSATTKTSKVKLTRTLYNLVFEEEKVAEAELYFQSPDQVRLDLRPAMVNRDDESQRIGKNGQPFRVVADRGETWIWTPKQLQLANDTDKTFEVMSIPNELKASKSPFASLVAFARAELFLPFLLDIHADQVRKDWTLSMKKNSGSSALLIAIPKSELSKACCSECWIVIDTTEWRTTAVKCFDQSGNIETVYKVNERKLNLEIPDSVFKPDLKAQGYQQVFPPESDP